MVLPPVTSSIVSTSNEARNVAGDGHYYSGQTNDYKPGNGIITLTKPKKPLSVYNYFFSHQRSLLFGEQFDEHLDSKMATQKKNRLHKKVHGQLNFCELAKHVGREWKNLDETSHSFYRGR